MNEFADKKFVHLLPLSIPSHPGVPLGVGPPAPNVFSSRDGMNWVGNVEGEQNAKKVMEGNILKKKILFLSDANQTVG